MPQDEPPFFVPHSSLVDQTALAGVNGRVVPLIEAQIPALDRGFLLGDAVYEVIRVYQGRPWLFDDHFRRLEHSLAEMRITGIELTRLQNRVLDTVAAGQFTEALIYIQVTRGAAPRKHAFPENIVPLEFFYVQEFADPYQEARQKGVATITFPDLRWQRCDIKSTNLLANVLAMQAAAESGCSEALLFKADGTVTEGTHTSLFAVREGSLVVPPQNPTILPGITRKLIQSLAQKGNIPIQEQSFQRKELHHFSELFVTGTTSEILPIVKVDEEIIGTGQPGEITRQLQQAYGLALQEFLAGKQ